jgi:FkbM family methyltransferase
LDTLARVLRKLAAHARATVRLWRYSRRVSTVLAATRFQRLWLRVVPVLLLWAAPFVGPANRGISVAFIFGGRTIRCVLGDLREYEVLKEVFVDEVYAHDLPPRAATIVDLGSNVGLSALYFMARYPGGRVLSVEPNPAVLGRLRRNVSQFGRVTIVPVAVADRDGRAQLSVPSGSTSGRLGDGRGYTVPTVTLDTLLAEHRFPFVDVLKFDIEGAEFKALGVADLSRIGALVGELHPERPGQIRELTTLLEHDYTVHTQPHPPRWLLRARRREPVRATGSTPGLT